ncbi:MAG: hypothetical protein PVI26_08610 [Chitinispirillia bacterium]|jgi:hypothetical protein
MPFVRSRASGIYVPKSEKLLDKVKEVLRYHHYSIRTEHSCCDWVKRYTLHFNMKSRDDLCNGEKESISSS